MNGNGRLQHLRDRGWPANLARHGAAALERPWHEICSDGTVGGAPELAPSRKGAVMTANQSGAERETNGPGAPYQVVAACDFSPLGDRAVTEALRACVQHRAAALHVITVAAEGPNGVILPGVDAHFIPHAEARERMQAHVGRLVDDFVARGPALPMEHVAVYVAMGVPSERIVSLAAAVDADLIVLGTHGRHGIGRMLLGSVAEEVVRRAPCGVFVIRPRDFLAGQKLPEIQPPLKAGEHPLLPFHSAPTYHYIHRMNREPGRIMPSI